MTQLLRISMAEREPRASQYILLALSHAALVMLHYFGALTVLALTLAGVVATRAPYSGSQSIGRARRIVLASAPAFLLLAAWLWLVILRSWDSDLAGNAAWITVPGIRSFASFASEVIGSFDSWALSWGVLAVLVLVVAWAATAGRSAPTRVLLAAALVPLALAFGAGWLGGPALWVSRYLIATIPALLILMAMAIEQLRRPWRSGAIVLLLGWSSLAGAHAVRSRAQKPDWVTMLRELGRGRPAQFCTNEPYVGLPLQFHALRDRLPVRVVDMAECSASAERTWAVYRLGTEASLAALMSRGARLRPRISLLTELPRTEARRIEWVR